MGVCVSCASVRACPAMARAQSISQPTRGNWRKCMWEGGEVISPTQIWDEVCSHNQAALWELIQIYWHVLPRYLELASVYARVLGFHVLQLFIFHIRFPQIATQNVCVLKLHGIKLSHSLLCLYNSVSDCSAWSVAKDLRVLRSTVGRVALFVPKLPLSQRRAAKRCDSAGCIFSSRFN